jgi:DUF4097 and DUF4098 domain-containing protein YvlB
MVMIMKYRKRYLSILALAIATLYLPTLLYADAVEKIEKSYAFGKDGRMTLQNVSGDITVKVWKDERAKITATHAGGPERDLNEVVHITQTGKEIRIVTRSDRSGFIFKSGRTSVDYELYIPESAHFRSETTSGSVEIAGVGGTVEAKTVSGTIKIVSARGSVKCKTISGDIDLKDIDGIADLKTTSGDIHVRRLTGSLEAESVSGDMDLDDIDGRVDLKTTSGDLQTTNIKGAVEAGSVSGDIDVTSPAEIKEIETETISGDTSVQGVFASDGSYVLSAHSGTIEIKLPGQSDFELNAGTYSGDIDCDFELKGYLHIEDKQLRGMVGKGGPSLNVSTYSGDIRIRKY